MFHKYRFYFYIQIYSLKFIGNIATFFALITCYIPEDMKTDLSQNSKKFFLHQKSGNSKIKIAAIAILALLIFGLMIDAFNNFYILRNAKSLAWGIGGLILLSLFYLIGEAGSEWINSKDDVSHPLHKRVFNLSVLLCIAGVVMAACWFVFKQFGW